MRTTKLVAKDTIVLVNDPIPQLGANDVLVRVLSCGLCGTDLQYIHGELDPPGKLPLTLGHEPFGRVAAVGSSVSNVGLDDYVLVPCIIPCHECQMCRIGRENLCASMQIVGCSQNGGFAEFMSVPGRAVLRIESDGTVAQALFSESIPSAYHALFEIAKLSSSQRVLVMGTGGIGLTTVYIASVSGLEVTVVGRKPWKLEKARDLGASNALSFDDLRNSSRDFEVAIDTTGIPAVIECGIRSIRPGGQVIVVGYPMQNFEVPGRRFMWYEQCIAGSRAFSHKTVLQALKFCKTKGIDPSRLVSHMFSLERIEDAVSLLSDGSASRILILPNSQ